MKTKATHVAVLMAVKNGLAYLQEQIDSILKQQNCRVTLFISDDCSTDGSLEYCRQLAQEDNAITILPKANLFGSAALNFYRLILDVNTDGYDYIALADQDDIWLPDKLNRHIKLAQEHAADGVSSNVTAFWPDGREQLLDKAQPQRELDYLFESAGPGCTFLMTPRLISEVRSQLQDKNSPAKDTSLHDWLIYAICRSHGWRWVIDSMPSVHYRQHHSNVLGANVGISAKWSRLLKLKQHWYRGEVLKIASISYKISTSPKSRQLIYLLINKTIVSQLKLLRYVPHSRRRTFDRLLLAGAILLGVF
ncbi:rhamnosyltransferase [biofilm metagenome]